MVKTQRFHCCGPGLVPGWGAKVPTWPKKKERERGMELQLALKFPLMFDVAKDKNEISEYKAKDSIVTLFWVPVLEVCSLPLTQLSV